MGVGKRPAPWVVRPPSRMPVVSSNARCKLHSTARGRSTIQNAVIYHWTVSRRVWVEAEIHEAMATRNLHQPARDVRGHVNVFAGK